MSEIFPTVRERRKHKTTVFQISKSAVSKFDTVFQFFFMQAGSTVLGAKCNPH